jgi:hypothetical protein
MKMKGKESCRLVWSTSTGMSRFRADSRDRVELCWLLHARAPVSRAEVGVETWLCFVARFRDR